MVKRIHEERNGIIVFVSHNMMDVASLSARVIVMDRGQIITVDTPKNVFGNRQLLKGIGLDVPPVTAFMNSLRDRGMDVNAGVLTYDDAAAVILDHFGFGHEQKPDSGSADYEGGDESC